MKALGKTIVNTNGYACFTITDNSIVDACFSVVLCPRVDALSSYHLGRLKTSADLR